MWPAIIVGAGAAGLMAAIFAARGGVRVLVVETRPRPGAKIRVSGGGRCNVLPSQVSSEDFHTSGSLHTLRNLVMSWPLEEVHHFFQHDLGIALKLEPSGKVFPCSDDAREVVAALLRACHQAGVTLRAPFRVAQIRREHDAQAAGFVLHSEEGELLRCRHLVLASGGRSLPKTGSDGAGMQMAQKLGHRLVPTYPCLVPLLNANPAWQELRGVSVRARLTAERDGRVLDQLEGDLLFTHRGFSGPVVLDASHHVTRPGGETVELRVHWGGSRVTDWDALLRHGGKQSVGALLRRFLPRRLAALLLQQAGVDGSCALSDLTRPRRLGLVSILQSTALSIVGNEGYKTAEVTGGGIPLSEIVTRSLESRIAPRLHFCGEILDATGRLGGYNFLWAWVTGRKVGTALAAAWGSSEQGA